MSLVIDERLRLTFDFENCRRWIAGCETVIHCHHYNSRIQSTIESAAAIDGKGLYISTAEIVFRKLLLESFRSTESRSERLAFCQNLYAHLGFGKLDLATIADGVVHSSVSHFVEGWKAGFPTRREPVCSFTQGYLQAVCSSVFGDSVSVHEVECQANGASSCRFQICRDRTDAVEGYEKTTVAIPPEPKGVVKLSSDSVDEMQIIRALAEAPIVGDDDGLIPAFNVYLASTPADFYNLLAIRFVEAMEQHNLGDVARAQLMHDAEKCGLNTFRGIVASDEWKSLIEPMVSSHEDQLFGIVAVSNALGWGNWHVTELEPFETLSLCCVNGYEAMGYQQLRGRAIDPACVMLAGVAAGIFELVYGEGSVEERFGQYASREETCTCLGDASCQFFVSTP